MGKKHWCEKQQSAEDARQRCCKKMRCKDVDSLSSVIWLLVAWEWMGPRPAKSAYWETSTSQRYGSTTTPRAHSCILTRAPPPNGHKSSIFSYTFHWFRNGLKLSSQLSLIERNRNVYVSQFYFYFYSVQVSSVSQLLVFSYKRLEDNSWREQFGRETSKRLKKYVEQLLTNIDYFLKCCFITSWQTYATLVHTYIYLKPLHINLHHINPTTHTKLSTFV